MDILTTRLYQQWWIFWSRRWGRGDLVPNAEKAARWVSQEEGGDIWDWILAIPGV